METMVATVTEEVAVDRRSIDYFYYSEYAPNDGFDAG